VQHVIACHLSRPPPSLECGVTSAVCVSQEPIHFHRDAVGSVSRWFCPRLPWHTTVPAETETTPRDPLGGSCRVKKSQAARTVSSPPRLSNALRLRLGRARARPGACAPRTAEPAGCGRTDVHESRDGTSDDRTCSASRFGLYRKLSVFRFYNPHTSAIFYRPARLSAPVTCDVSTQCTQRHSTHTRARARARDTATQVRTRACAPAKQAPC
jgi:hypothetical protein